MKESDLFANFERMRRQIDELFGDVWQRAGYVPHGRPTFSPRVDVYQCGDPPRVVVKVDISGVNVENVDLEVQGRELVISGERETRESETKTYQQIEIESGYFERQIDLGVEVAPARARATYEEGMLKVELPVAEQNERPSSVPINEQGDK